MALSKRHKAFIDEYIACYFNGTEAYRRVYPNASKETAWANSSKLLSMTKVDEEIKRRVAERAMSADEVLMRLTEQARAEYADYITLDARVDVAKMVNDGKAHLIKGIKETQFARNIEFCDAQAALVTLGKHHKLWVERQEISGPDGDAIHIKLDR